MGPLLLGAQTDRGLAREINEDAFGLPSAAPDLLASRGYLCAVADGVGGHGNGQEASATVIASLYGQFYGPEAIDLARAVQLSNMAVRRQALQASGHDYRMSSTLVALLICGTTFQIAHVGDSRAYLVRRGAIFQLTSDHSLVQEQVLAGRLDAAAARTHQQKNVITRAMGSDSIVDADLSTSTDLQIGDTFVLCSDGLTNHVDDTVIASLAARYTPDRAAPQLIQLANRAGGLDNITVVLIRYAPSRRLGGGFAVRWKRPLLWLLVSIGGSAVIGLLVLLVWQWCSSR
jgi:protein phosphatase